MLKNTANPGGRLTPNQAEITDVFAAISERYVLLFGANNQTIFQQVKNALVRLQMGPKSACLSGVSRERLALGSRGYQPTNPRR